MLKPHVPLKLDKVTPTIQEQIAEVKRELGFRAYVYPRLIDDGKLKLTDAERQEARMKAVLETLQSIEAKERLL